MSVDVTQKNVERLVDLSLKIRLDALDMALASGNNGSHLGGGLSCVEIMAVLYGEILKYDIKKPLDDDRDIFIPSKNHCVLSHIPALAYAGFIPHNEILEFQKDGGRLTGYPQRKEIGLEYSGGSLGMAVSVGIGLALSAKERKSKSKIFILMGDGELNEGSVWEAFMAAAHYKLDNLIVVIDRNRLSYDGNTEDVMGLDNLEMKMNSFNWLTSVCDGHNVKDLLLAFDNFEENKPHIIIANTVKGKGISFIENKPEWHHHRLSEKEYELAKNEVLGGKIL